MYLVSLLSNIVLILVPLFCNYYTTENSFWVWGFVWKWLFSVSEVWIL